MADIDLTKGAPTADAASERRRRRRERTADAKTESSESSGPTESEVRTQIARAFDGLAKSRNAKGDDELADAIVEEADAMTEGFVTLTNNVKVLRMPLVILLNLMITLLAFGRVGAILLGRLNDRRIRKQAEREAAAGMEPAFEYVPDVTPAS